MIRRTPLEQQIAKTSDRRAAYAERMRAAGFRQLGLWVHSDDVQLVRDYAATLRAKRGEPDAG